MVFGLALSLGALTLINLPLQSPNELYAGLGIFGFSFIILVTVWYRYSTIMVSLPLETQTLLVANLVLLFVVAIEPYLLYVVYFGPDAVRETASVLYALDVASMNVVLGGFLHVLSQEERRLVPPESLRRIRILRDFAFGIGLVFLVTALPVFWTWAWAPNIPSRVFIWVLTLPTGWIVRAVNR